MWFLEDEISGTQSVKKSLLAVLISLSLLESLVNVVRFRAIRGASPSCLKSCSSLSIFTYVLNAVEFLEKTDVNSRMRAGRLRVVHCCWYSIYLSIKELVFCNQLVAAVHMVIQTPKRLTTPDSAADAGGQ
eukprot:1402154-Amphidinium_carterae.1